MRRCGWGDTLPTILARSPGRQGSFREKTINDVRGERTTWKLWGYDCIAWKAGSLPAAEWSVCSGTLGCLARVLGITAAEAPAHLALNEASLKDRVTDFERQLIEKALADANSNISEAARLLGVKRTTLIEKMGRLNIAKR